jgi:hypothetical protein
MTAMYAADTFVLQLASGTSIHIEAGSLRDSVTHAAIIAAAPAGFFTSTAPLPGVGHVSSRLFGHLAAYPQGAETK